MSVFDMPHRDQPLMWRVEATKDPDAETGWRCMNFHASRQEAEQEILESLDSYRAIGILHVRTVIVYHEVASQWALQQEDL